MAESGFRTSTVPLVQVLRSLEEVFDAWNGPGYVPLIQRRKRARLRRDWPLLAGALDQLTAVVTQYPEPR